MNAAERLHFEFLGEPFLFANLRIDSFGPFVAAASFIAAICFSERIITLAISRHWNPLPIFRRTRVGISIWRTVLYWVVTLQRMLYMLAAMTLNLWVLVVIVTSLALGQFIIEYTDTPGPVVNHRESVHLLPRHSQDVNGVKEPLLATSADDYESNSTSPYQQEHRYPSPQTYPHSISPLQMSPSFQYTPPLTSDRTDSVTTRPRSKSKPDGIFIHPKHSNIARAEVIAVGMGLGVENSEYVDASSYTYPRSPSQANDTSPHGNQRGWGAGNGRDVARGLLGGSGSITNAGS